MFPALRLLGLASLPVILTACGAVSPPPAPTTAPGLQTQIVGTATALRLTASAPSTLPAVTLTAPPASLTVPPAPATLTPLAATPEPGPATLPPSPSELPTLTAAPPAALPAATPVILSFLIDQVHAVRPGATLNLEWRSENAVTVTLQHVLANGLLGGQGQAELPASGSLALVTDGRARNTQLFALTAYNAAGPSLPTNIYVSFQCPYPYFFSPGFDFCPDGPAVAKTVVEQPFEGGRLLWIPNDAGAVIYALFNDGQVYAMGDLWSPSQPDRDPSLTPPAGRYQPVHGFGLFWRQTDWVRQALGWALAPEVSHTTDYQEEEGGVDSKGGSYFVRLADGQVVQISFHYLATHWRYLN